MLIRGMSERLKVRIVCMKLFGALFFRVRSTTGAMRTQNDSSTLDDFAVNNNDDLPLN